MQNHIRILSKSKDPRYTAYYSNFYTVLKAITQDKVYTLPNIHCITIMVKIILH